jgi:hypothetical protein
MESIEGEKISSLKLSTKVAEEGKPKAELDKNRLEV